MNRHDFVTPTNAKLLYDEVTQEINDNILSIKILKDRHRIQAEDKQAADPTSIIDVNCLDKYGKKCKKGCPKINVIHDPILAPKEPEEEILLLRTIRQIDQSDGTKHGVEVEYKSPRNYIPLPEPGPPPPIIVPKEPIVVKDYEIKKKKKKKK